MTADPAIAPATFIPNAASCLHPDPVRARVTAGLQLTYAESMQSESAEAGHQGLHLPPDTRGPRKPHPGDILYWVACLGGACLLLLSATT